MIKKKTPDQEDPKQQKHNETADIKEDSNAMENIERNRPENVAPEDAVTQKEEPSVPEEAPADKDVREEKTDEEKLAEMQDKYIRLSAEFDNYRKRTLREKIEISKYASEDLLLRILPIMDDFERAISHMESTTDFAAMKAGIDLIYGKLADFLKQNGIKEIESMNCPFNVDLHDAIAKIAVQEEDKKGKIVDVVQKGYYLYDKVVRHSKVVVGE